MAPFSSEIVGSGNSLLRACYLQHSFQQCLTASNQQTIVGVLERRVTDPATTRHEQHPRRHTGCHRARVVSCAASHTLPRSARALADSR